MDILLCGQWVINFHLHKENNSSVGLSALCGVSFFPCLLGITYSIDLYFFTVFTWGEIEKHTTEIKFSRGLSTQLSFR